VEEHLRTINVASEQRRPKVLLADDHSIIAEALRALLCDQCDIVGIVADGRALIAKALELQPDLIVLDIGMPLLSGMEAAEQIRKSMPGMRLVFLTMMEDPNLAAAALRFAPVGYVLKHSAASELMIAIHEVLSGRSFVTRRMKDESQIIQDKKVEPVSKRLTARQRDVLKLLAEGRLMKEIADLLQVSEKTVEFHKYQIMRTFTLHSNAELVLFALKSGVISSR
jgi:DNA-binding NarL/FixJ family response regulator